MGVGLSGLGEAASKATSAAAKQNAMQDLNEQMVDASKTSAFGHNLRMSIINNFPRGG